MIKSDNNVSSKRTKGNVLFICQSLCSILICSIKSYFITFEPAGIRFIHKLPGCR